MSTIKHQVKTFERLGVMIDGEKVDIIAEVRHDDSCGNGRNSFAITGSIYKAGRRAGSAYIAGGCIHDEIAKYFPELESLLKWHLCSTDEPMYYVANTLYWAKDIPAKYTRFVYLVGAPFGERDVLLGIFNKADELDRLKTYFAPLGEDALREELKEQSPARAANLKNARSSAVWPDATLDQLRDEKALRERLPALMVEFKAAVESLGMTF